MKVDMNEYRRKRRNRRRMPLKIVAAVLSLAIFFFLCNSLWTRYQQLVEIENELDTVEAQIQQERDRQKELEMQLRLLQDSEYIELLARQELRLIRPKDIPYRWYRGY